MTVEDVSTYLKTLRAKAGAPTVRQLATVTSLGKTTINDAFNGKRLATWPVTAAIVRALGGNEQEARALWAQAAHPATARTDIPDWLTGVRADIPELVTGPGFEAACALAASSPREAIAVGWEALRLSAVQLAGRYHDDIPGNWSSNIVATLERAETERLLPGGSAAAAHALHKVHVSQQMDPHTPAPISTALQMVFLAHRLAWEAWDAITRPEGPPQG
ncbi:helix-turn-helix domain-containing protein [Kitasatospora cineracea]